MGKRRRTKRGYELSKRCRCADRTRCSHDWWLRVFARGQRQRINLTELFPHDSKDVAAAKAKEAAQQGLIVNGERVGGRTDTRHTLKEVVDHFVKAHGEQKKYYYLRAWRRLLGDDRPLADVATIDVEGAIQTWLDRKRAKGVRGGAHAERHLKQAGSQFFKWAVQRGYLTRTPFKSLQGDPLIPRLSKQRIRPRTRRLEAGEEARILDATVSDPYVADFFVAMLETGCRPGELRTLQWSEVREDKFFVLASKAKDREQRDVPIEPKLRAILDRRRIGPDGERLPDAAYVFGDDTGELVGRERLNGRWRKVCKAAKVTNLHLHDLRREFASQLHESDVPIAVVRDALGHANVSMTNTYLGVGQDAKRRAYAQRTAKREATTD